jgi:hypothetical protein
MIPADRPSSFRARTAKRAIAVALTVAVAAVLSFMRTAHADSPPTQQQIAFAQETWDLMFATIFAGLSQEFSETTPANVEQGKKSISLIFNDSNDDMRLIGTLSPLRANDVPQDSFETDALTAAMSGQSISRTEKVHGKWYFRKSVALSNFHASCSMCHANFGPVNASQWVGALSLRVPTAD